MPRVRLPAAVRDQWPRILLALVGGGLCPLAYAPFGWWPVAFLAPAVLVYLVADPDRGWALPAYAWGVGWFAAGGFWIYHSVMFYGGGFWAAVIFCIVLALLFGLIPLLAVGLWRLLRPRHEALALMAALPLAWVLVEWVRGWLFTGITWLQLGYTQTDTWLNGFAPVIGSLGISLLVAVGAGALAWTARRPSQQRILPVVAGVALVFVAGLALRQADWTEAAGEPLSAALLQGNISQDVKWDPEYREFIMDRYRRLTSEHWGVDLVVWPETAVPMYQNQASAQYLAPLADEAAFHGTDLLLGLPTFDESSRRAYNSVMTLGEQVGFYHKRHLVPFGEYVPFREHLGGLLDVFGAPTGDFSSGAAAGTLRAGGQPAAISICYEVIFPRLVAHALPEATYLVNVSNDGWFGRTIGPHQHLQMARMRAMEFRRPLLRSTNTGITAAVDERGRITERAPQFRPASLTATIQPRQGATPYLRWLNAPVVGVCAIGLVVFGALRWYPAATRS